MSIQLSYKSASSSDVSKTGVMLLDSICIPAYSEMEMTARRSSHQWVGNLDPGGRAPGKPGCIDCMCSRITQKWRAVCKPIEFMSWTSYCLQRNENWQSGNNRTAWGDLYYPHKVRSGRLSCYIWPSGDQWGPTGVSVESGEQKWSSLWWWVGTAI